MLCRRLAIDLVSGHVKGGHDRAAIGDGPAVGGGPAAFAAAADTSRSAVGG
jgi:hypothetical protein